MRGEERDVVGDRLLNAFRFDGQMAETSPGKFALPLGLLLWYHGLWQRQVWYQRKSAALRRQAKGFKSASGGTPPSLPQLMLGSQRRATKPLTALTRSGA
jgi:hypothetical protein